MISERKRSILRRYFTAVNELLDVATLPIYANKQKEMKSEKKKHLKNVTVKGVLF